MAKLYNNDMIMNLAKMLISGNKTPMEQALYSTSTIDNLRKQGMTNAGINSLYKDISVTTKNGISGLSGTDNLTETGILDLQKAMQPALDKANTMQDISKGVSLGQLGNLALGAAKAHPFKTAGLVGLGAGNIGGLTDNDKFGGQLAGLGLGGLGAHMMASGNPYLAAMMTMGGGALGSLFDKLRAKKEQEQQQGIPNAGNPIAMMNRR